MWGSIVVMGNRQHQEELISEQIPTVSDQSAGASAAEALSAADVSRMADDPPRSVVLLLPDDFKLSGNLKADLEAISQRSLQRFNLAPNTQITFKRAPKNATVERLKELAQKALPGVGDTWTMSYSRSLQSPIIDDGEIKTMTVPGTENSHILTLKITF